MNEASGSNEDSDQMDSIPVGDIPLPSSGDPGGIDEDEDDKYNGDLAGPTVDAHVDLSKKSCKCPLPVYYCNMLSNSFTVRKVYPEDITMEFQQPNFPNLIQQFIYNQEHLDGHNSDISLSVPPMFYGKFTIYPSAVTTSYTPSEILGISGMHCECIHAVNSWRKGAHRHDTILVNTDASAGYGWS